MILILFRSYFQNGAHKTKYLENFLEISESNAPITIALLSAFTYKSWEEITTFFIKIGLRTIEISMLKVLVQ